MAKYQSLNENLVRALECPLCLETMTAPIYLCATGHSFCEACWGKLDKCPTCKLDLQDTRNYALEAVTEQLLYPCDNKLFGCEEMLTLKEITEHLTKCRFREYRCQLSPHAPCNFLGRLNDLTQHVYHKHPLYVAQGNPSAFSWRCNYRADATYMMVCFDQLFYVHRRLRKHYMYFMVQYLGNPDEAGNYYFLVYIKDAKEEKRAISVMEKCHDDLVEDVNDLLINNHWAAIPLIALNTFKIQNIIRYVVHIRRNDQRDQRDQQQIINIVA